MFSFFLSDNDYSMQITNPPSTCIIGGFDLDTFSEEKNIKWIELFDNTGFWTVPLNGLSLGKEDLQIQSKVGIVDSGTSLLAAPYSEGLTVMTKLS